MSSVDENKFRSVLQKTKDSVASTPVRALDLKTLTRRSLQTVMVGENDSATLKTTTQRSSMPGELGVVVESTGESETVALPPVLEESLVTDMEGNIESSPPSLVPARPLHAEAEIHSASPAPHPIITAEPQVEAIATATTADDYRKDWFEILRARNVNLNYENTTVSQKRRIPRPKNIRPKVLPEWKAAEKSAEGKVNNTAHVLQQVLHGILPQLPPPPPSQSIEIAYNPDDNEDLNLTNDSQNAVTATNHHHSSLQAPGPISPGQERYHRFILDNTESLTKILDNLEPVRRMLEMHKQQIEEQVAGGNYRREPSRYFDPEILLNAPLERLEVKHCIIQNLIRQDSFDMNKLPVIKNKMTAAIGFAFALELKAAGLISLSPDGRTIALL